MGWIITIDHTPDSAVESHIITHNVPRCGAIITFTWATLAMRPDAIFPNTNGSTAVDWHAMSGHTFPIDGGTTPPLSKPQEAALSPTIGSGHDATTHGGKEASCPHSPISVTFSDPEATTLFSHNQAAIAFKRDHPYHPPDPLGHQEREPPSFCAVDNTVADMPTPLLPAKEKHFAASPGPHMK